MKSFRTIVQVPKKANYDHRHRFHFEGSCFAENIRRSMEQCGFDCTGGHHGILYHPLAMAQSIDEVLQQKKYEANDLFCSGEKWVSLSHHGSFSNVNREEAMENINASIEEGFVHLTQADVLIVTFGTSWAWKHKESNRVVGNCHRLPQQAFTKELSSVSEMAMTWMVLMGNLLEKNDQLNIVFTVSPVRHTREGMEENNLSKAQLRLLCHELVKAFPNRATYFPAYEIMMDDLRDYRFYELDMIHPNGAAIEYIRDVWAQAYVDPTAWKAALEIEKLIRFVEHRPSAEGMPKHAEKSKEIFAQIENLKKQSFSDGR